MGFLRSEIREPRARTVAVWKSVTPQAEGDGIVEDARRAESVLKTIWWEDILRGAGFGA